MKLLYLTQWFDPEPGIIKGSRFVRAIEAAGHEVTVVTGFPNYPTGKLHPGYRLRPLMRETIDGARVVRLPLYPSHDASSLRRALNFLSFFVSALLYCLFRRDHYAIAYVYHPPITVGLAAALSGLARRLPFVIEIQDLWPDAVTVSGMTGARIIARVLDRVCGFVYRRAAAIIVQSEGMRLALIKRGVPAAKITTIRNWAEAEFAAPTAIDHAGASVADARFTIVYGGNLGPAQALETVIDAAAIIQHARDDIDILLYGDGIKAAALRDRAVRAGLTMLRFNERLTQRDILPVFARADALLLHLGGGPPFEVTIPSKTQAYLAVGRPIVAGIAGEGADLLRESSAAIVVPPGDADALARAIGTLADLPRERREAMGASGRSYYLENLSFDRAIVRTLHVVEGIYRGDRRTDRATPQ